MNLQGGRELRARLNALKLVFKPIARKWGRAAVNSGRPMVPVKTGRLRRSMRILSVSAKKARVGAHYTAYFVDAGSKPHFIRSRSGQMLTFKSRGKTIYARAVHHRGVRARPFRQRMAEEGLRQTPLAREVVDAWNRAA